MKNVKTKEYIILLFLNFNKATYKISSKAEINMKANEIKKLNELQKKYNRIIEEFENINENFHYNITEEGEYRCYITEYGSDYDLNDNYTEITIFKTKDKKEFVEILKKLDGTSQYFSKDIKQENYNIKFNGELDE